MKINFLGTGAAEGIPALFCNCEYCKSVRLIGGKSIRSRSQVILDKELSIDFPPDAFYHEANFHADLSAIRYILFTHAHMDHCYAHDFVLRGYKYAFDMTAKALDVYGNQEICDVFQECTRREIKAEIANTIGIHAVDVFQKFSFGDWSVHSLKARHSSSNPLLYLVEKDGKRYLHLYDTGLLFEENYAYLKKVVKQPIDCVVLDCTFLFEKASENMRHMGLKEDMEVLHRLQEMGLVDEHTKKVITHFSHCSKPSPDRLKRAEEEYGVIAAYDGLQIEI